MPAGTNTGTIYYTVEADTSALVNSSSAVDAQLNQLTTTFARTDKAANDTQFQMTKTASAVKGLGTQAQGTNSGLSSLYKTLVGLVTIKAAQGIIDMADSYGEMAERIRMATSSTDEYDHVQQRLLASANRTFRPLQEAQELFVLTNSTLKSLGLTTDQAMDVVDSLSLAFVKNATASDRAQSAINAVTGSLAKGKVDAQAWQTIIAATPTIVDDMAQATGRTTAEILALGAQGKITAAELTNTLQSSLESNGKAADSMAVTVKDAFTNLKNNLQVFIGEANQSTGATQLLSGALTSLGDNIETVVNVALAAGAGVVARYIAQLGAQVISSGRAMLAARAQAAEELNLARAQQAATAAALEQAAATRGLTTAHGQAAAAATAHAAAVARVQAAQTAMTTAGGLLLRVLGGPVGIVALLASAATAVLTFGNNASSSASKVDALKGSVDLLNVSLKEMGANMLTNTRLKIGDELEDLGKSAAVAKLQIESLGTQMNAMPVDSPLREGMHREMMQAAADYETLTDRMAGLINKQKEIDAQLQAIDDRRAKGTSKASDPEVEKRLQSMRDELALAQQVGAARARLQAIQRLGANATAEERAEAERLATQIYELETAHKAAGTATKESTKASKEDAKVINQLATELLGGAQATRDMAQAAAEASLSKYATPEQIAQVRELAGALFDLKQQQQNQQLLNTLDPVAGEQNRFQTELQQLQQLNADKELEDDRYLQLKEQKTVEHEQRMQQIQEAEFRAQSTFNDMLMGSLDALGSAGTNAITGVLTGLTSASDAARQLGQAVLNEVVGSFVKMGVEYVKNLIIGQTAQAATTAAGIAQAATLAAAWAPAAALASLASFGANAAPAMAGIGSTMALSQGLALVGSAGRLTGGPVAANGLYRVNEGGRPEILNAVGGQQYLLPNTRGQVVSNRDATTRQTAPAHVTVNLIEDAQRGGQVDQQQMDAETIITVFVSDIRGGGKAANAIEGTYGVRRQGR